MLCLSLADFKRRNGNYETKVSLWLFFLLLLGITWLNFSKSVQAQTPLSTPSSGTKTPPSAEDNFHHGNLTYAIQQWSHDIKNGININDALFNRSQAYILLKQYDFAVQDLNRLIQIQGSKTPSQVYVVQGIALTELNQLQAAIQSFNQAEKINPSELVYSNRALAYQRSGQFKEALLDLTKSVQMAPTPVNQLNLANLQLQLAKYDQVVDEMNKLIAHEKYFFPAYLTRGIANYNLGKYELAIRDFVSSLTILPEQPEAYYYAGLSFAKLNRKDDATKNLLHSADLFLKQNQSNSYHQVLEKMNELNLQ